MLNTVDVYQADGVNVEEGDSFSAFAGKLCQQSYGNSPYVEVKDFSMGHFRGPRGFRLKGLPENSWYDNAPDGIGTKVVIIDAAFAYDTAASNLVAMSAGDITHWGGLPLAFVNIMDVSTLGEEGDATNIAFRKMMTSLSDVAKQQGFVMFKGETAELGVCVGADNPGAPTKFNWGGVMFGAYNPETIITGDNISAGQAIIALKEVGFRCNGISSVRKSLAMRFGEQWWNNNEATEAIRQAAAPAVLYDKFLAIMNGWFESDFAPIIKASLIVHVTGGSLKSKLADDILFPRGLSVRLDNLCDIPHIMKNCAEWRGMDGKQLYKTWSGGQGVLVVVDKTDVDNFIGLASQHGIQAQKCGEITQESAMNVTIISKLNGEEITFEP